MFLQYTTHFDSVRKHAIYFPSVKIALALGLARPKLFLFEKLSERRGLGSAEARERSAAVFRRRKLTAGSRKEMVWDTLPASACETVFFTESK